MRVIRASSVNDAFQQACRIIQSEPENFKLIAPRDGKETMEFMEPVTTVYRRPWQRVLLSEARDANPYFHLMESLWMLAGRSDAEWLAQFSSKIGQYAEDDGLFHGAYGHRWLRHFPVPPEYQEFPMDPDDNLINQLYVVVKMLRENPDTRRVVLAMWDPTYDLAAKKRDLPCNTHVYLKIRDGALHMTVCCRSNDIVLGCYGANAVHFSVLQEYLAAAIGVEIGTYTQISDSWHYYLSNPFVRKLLDGAPIDHPAYYTVGVAYAQTRALALVNGPIAHWNDDLANFMSPGWDEPETYSDIFFRGVAYLMRDSWECYKRGDLVTAASIASRITAPDWRKACVEWITRRQAKKGEPT